MDILRNRMLIFSYKALYELLFVVILNCETASEFGGASTSGFIFKASSASFLSSSVIHCRKIRYASLLDDFSIGLPFNSIVTISFLFQPFLAIRAKLWRLWKV